MSDPISSVVPVSPLARVADRSRLWALVQCKTALALVPPAQVEEIRADRSKLKHMGDLFNNGAHAGPHDSPTALRAWKALLEVAKSLKYTVNTVGDGGEQAHDTPDGGASLGWSNHADREIWIDGTMGAAGRVATLGHELGHSLCNAFEASLAISLCGVSPAQEIEAELMSWLVQSWCGINCGDRTRLYLLDYLCYPRDVLAMEGAPRVSKVAEQFAAKIAPALRAAGFKGAANA